MAVITHQKDLVNLLQTLAYRKSTPATRSIWLAAVEDALRAALSQDSSILQQFRKEREKEGDNIAGYDQPAPDKDWVQEAIKATIDSIPAISPAAPTGDLDDSVALAVTRQYFKSWPFGLVIAALSVAAGLFGLQLNSVTAQVHQIQMIRDAAKAEVSAAQGDIEKQVSDINKLLRDAKTSADTKVGEIIKEVGTPEKIREDIEKKLMADVKAQLQGSLDKFTGHVQDQTQIVDTKSKDFVDGLPAQINDLTAKVSAADARTGQLEGRLRFAQNHTQELKSLLDAMAASSPNKSLSVPVFLAESFWYSFIALLASMLLSVTALVLWFFRPRQIS